MKHYPTLHPPARSTCRLLGALALFVGGPFLLLPIAADQPDAEVSSAISRAFWIDSSIPANTIDVTVVQGVATLTGEVDTLLAHRRAVAATEAVRGVRSVVNRLKVRPSDLADNTIEQSVEAALLADPATDRYQTSVAVDDGAVTLTGSVDSWRERELSADVAAGVRGVRKVENNLTVSYASDRSDTEIKAEIDAGLNQNVWLEGHAVQTKVDDGKVTLTGTLGSLAEQRAALREAWVANVTDVDYSGITIEPWINSVPEKSSPYARPSDSEIAQAIDRAFLVDPRVFSFNPDVNVYGGVATLTGVVDNLEAKRAAEQDARNTVGVIEVRNYLKVRPENPVDAATLRDRVTTALDRDSLLYDEDIAVTARDDGTVYLSGWVDSPLDRAQATSITSSLNGVTDVRNRLKLLDPTATYLNYVYDPYLYYPAAPLLYTSDYRWHSSDERVEAAIESELTWSPFVDADDVDVSVNRGTATLTGTVDSWSEIRAATENALEGGATWVDNRLKLETDQSS